MEFDKDMCSVCMLVYVCWKGECDDERKNLLSHKYIYMKKYIYIYGRMIFFVL